MDRVLTAKERTTLAAHLKEYHPKLRRGGKTWSWAHLNWHWRYWSNHYHKHDPATGPSGPNNRPRGWYTGEDAIPRS